eukprot:446061_1
MAEQKQNTNGFTEWKVTRNLLEQFKNAKHKQEFHSPSFETIDGAVWRILFYPHGCVSSDHCSSSISLKCVKLNGSKQPTGVCFSFNISEMDWCYDLGYTFKNGGPAWGVPKAFKSEKINDLERMTIECFVSEAMDVTDDKTYFEWKVSHHWMQRWE